MLSIIDKAINKLDPSYGGYTSIIWRNRLRNLFAEKQQSKYLFILSPPYCGSTLLSELLCTSKSVSSNNYNGTREGQTLPTVRKTMFNHSRRWDSELDLDWIVIKKEWRKYWDVTRPVLLEKSPPNILRAISIEKAFSNAHFVILHRNPYAHCESLIRRGSKSAYNAATFATKCLEAQKLNILNLKSRVQVSYEVLTDNPLSAFADLISLIPELNDIDFDVQFSAHNFLDRQMTLRNLNEEKIANLSTNQMKDINSVFNKHKDLFTYFNYEMIEPTE